MFSTFRRRSKRPDPASIQTSPSLPELNNEQAIPWPEELVDVAAVQQAAKVSFQGSSRGSSTTVPYHLPFRDQHQKDQQQPHERSGRISALYATVGKHPPNYYPPSAFAIRQVVVTNANVAATTMTMSPGRYSQRRARVVPTFNLLVRLTYWLWSPCGCWSADSLFWFLDRL